MDGPRKEALCPQAKAGSPALQEARDAWLRSVPQEVRQSILSEREVVRILEWSEHFFRTGCPEALAEVESATYRLASQMEVRVGQDGTLRYLRDGMARALAPCVRASPNSAENVIRILGRVTDAAWRAHTDALQATIELQRSERLHHELMVAKRIQERLLPRTVPEIPGYDIAGHVLPAAEVGGDYWSCKNYPEDDIVTFKLADVTGHGIGAATLVAAVKFISGGYYRGAKTAAQVIQRTNTVLVRETPSDILVTMVYGWLFPESAEMNIVNAGHSPVLHYRRGQFCAIPPTGMALGMIETRYREIRVPLERGDLLFTCSDGVTEPIPDGSLGEAWVRQQVREGADLPAAALVEHVLQGALATYGTPKDDMSVLVIKRTG